MVRMGFSVAAGIRRWTLDKLLKGAGAGSAPTEIDVPPTMTIATGSYTGDASDNRQITVGFKCSFVLVQEAGTHRWTVIPNVSIHDEVGSDNALRTDCLLHAADGFEVDNNWANLGAVVYYYWAISE